MNEKNVLTIDGFRQLLNLFEENFDLNMLKENDMTLSNFCTICTEHNLFSLRKQRKIIDSSNTNEVCRQLGFNIAEVKELFKARLIKAKAYSITWEEKLEVFGSRLNWPKKYTPGSNLVINNSDARFVCADA